MGIPKTVLLLLVFGTASCFAKPTPITGKIVYVSFKGNTTLRAIDLADKDSVSVLLDWRAFPPPLWSQSSATDGSTVFYYSFLTDSETSGITLGYDLQKGRHVFQFRTDYYWRIGYDPKEPDFLYGLTIKTNNIELQRLNTKTGDNVTVGSLLDGYINPHNSAVYDPTTHTFYAFVQGALGGENVSAIGIDVTTGSVVSNATIDPTMYVCEIVQYVTTGEFYGLVLENGRDLGLAKIDPATGRIVYVTTKTIRVTDCDAGAAISPKQKLFFGYVKSATGAPMMTVWDIGTGALYDQFAVESSVYGMQYFN